MIGTIFLVKHDLGFLFIRDSWLPISGPFLRACQSDFRVKRDTLIKTSIKPVSKTTSFCVN